MYGAAGGNSGFATGGKPAEVTFTMNVTPGTNYSVYVGTVGSKPTAGGGYSSGGAGGATTSYSGGGGGGSSGIKDGATIVAVAAGGGGAGGRNSTSYGGTGGQNGGNGGYYRTDSTYGGKGATQTAPGAGGTASPAGSSGSGSTGGAGSAGLIDGGGGGGAGYYGGGGGSGSSGSLAGGGGGGSSYVNSSYNTAGDAAYTSGATTGQTGNAGVVTFTWTTPPAVTWTPPSTHPIKPRVRIKTPRLTWPSPYIVPPLTTPVQLWTHAHVAPTVTHHGRVTNVVTHIAAQPTSTPSYSYPRGVRHLITGIRRHRADVALTSLPAPAIHRTQRVTIKAVARRLSGVVPKAAGQPPVVLWIHGRPQPNTPTQQRHHSWRSSITPTPTPAELPYQFPYPRGLARFITVFRRRRVDPPWQPTPVPAELPYQYPYPRGDAYRFATQLRRRRADLGQTYAAGQPSLTHIHGHPHPLTPTQSRRRLWRSPLMPTPVPAELPYQYPYPRGNAYRFATQLRRRLSWVIPTAAGQPQPALWSHPLIRPLMVKRGSRHDHITLIVVSPAHNIGQQTHAVIHPLTHVKMPGMHVIPQAFIPPPAIWRPWPTRGRRYSLRGFARPIAPPRLATTTIGQVPPITRGRRTLSRGFARPITSVNLAATPRGAVPPITHGRHTFIRGFARPIATPISRGLIPTSTLGRRYLMRVFAHSVMPPWLARTPRGLAPPITVGRRQPQERRPTVTVAQPSAVGKPVPSITHGRRAMTRMFARPMFAPRNIEVTTRYVNGPTRIHINRQFARRASMQWTPSPLAPPTPAQWRPTPHRGRIHPLTKMRTPVRFDILPKGKGALDEMAIRLGQLSTRWASGLPGSEWHAELAVTRWLTGLPGVRWRAGDPNVSQWTVGYPRSG